MNCPTPCRCWTGCRVCHAGWRRIAPTPPTPSASTSGDGRAAIPVKRNEAAAACPAWIYTNRNRVERLWARLKEWRGVATRYKTTARSFVGVLCLAATLD